MAITFPNSPSSGTTHTAENGVQYRYDGEKWITIGSYNASVDNAATFVNVSGDTMTGDLTVQGRINSGDVDSGNGVRISTLV